MTSHDLESRTADMLVGGGEASGYGRFGGKARVAGFTELRWITLKTQPGQYAI